jgi:hypothetical protein
MAFAQLTYRESLRDIEVCLSAQAAKRENALGMQVFCKHSMNEIANRRRCKGSLDTAQAPG